MRWHCALGIRSGKSYVVTADIRRCFDSVDHDVLLRLVGDVIGDRDALSLLRQWLTADVIDFMDVLPSELGVPQGEAISPLLANVYLDPMDKEFERAGASRSSGMRMTTCCSAVRNQKRSPRSS